MTLRTREVRARDGGLRWTILAGDQLVWADTTRNGVLLDLQTDDYIGGTGSADLDRRVAEHIAGAMARRHESQRLDELDRRRWGRVQGPRDRDGWGRRAA